MMFRRSAVLVPLGILSVAGLSAALAMPSAAVPQPASFAMCAACHTTTANGAHGMGPNLKGVVGRRAASKSGFTYSAAMRRANVTWNRAELDAYIASPRQKVPGTNMVYAGLKDPVKRSEIISYLVSLK